MSEAIARAREEFLALVEGVRPELHRYCARLTGSVLEGEDLVQETLARGFFALGSLSAPPALRPWLFRIAHNAAVDHLKRPARSRTELHEDVAATADRVAGEVPPDPAVVRAALARFLVLPVLQRGAVILKDVLGHSLEEVAETLETTVPAVKAALVRGRLRLRSLADEERRFEAGQREDLQRYATLFNARDWEGVRSMIAEDCRLDLVSKAQRRGAEVRQYFDRYAREAVTLRPVGLEGQVVLAAHVAGAESPAYVVVVGFEGDRVATIRDYRYVPYLVAEAEIVELEPLP